MSEPDPADHFVHLTMHNDNFLKAKAFSSAAVTVGLSEAIRLAPASNRISTRPVCKTRTELIRPRKWTIFEPRLELRERRDIS